MAIYPALQPIAPALQGRYLGLINQGIPQDIAAADILGTIQEVCFELPNSEQPGTQDIINAVREVIRTAHARLHAAAMS